MSDKTAHIVLLDQLEIGEHLFDFQLDSTYLTTIENTELLGGAVDVKVRLILREDDFAVDMDIVGQVQVTCDRCLDAMNVDVDTYPSLCGYTPTALGKDQVPAPSHRQHSNRRQASQYRTQPTRSRTPP